MGTMTIRNVDDALKRRLRIRAAHHGRSMEEEARDILRSALSEKPAAQSLLQSIRSRLLEGGVELDIPKREPAPDPIDFSE
jgi:plasmid stability protein